MVVFCVDDCVLCDYEGLGEKIKGCVGLEVEEEEEMVGFGGYFYLYFML